MAQSDPKWVDWSHFMAGINELPAIISKLTFKIITYEFNSSIVCPRRTCNGRG